MPEVNPSLLVISMWPLIVPPGEIGLKFVLFQIDGMGHDYGFAYWNGICFDEVDPKCHVIKWAEMPRPMMVM